MPETGEFPGKDIMTPEITFGQRQVDRVVAELRNPVPARIPQITSITEHNLGVIPPLAKFTREIRMDVSPGPAQGLPGSPSSGIEGRSLSPEQLEEMRRLRELRAPFIEMILNAETFDDMRVGRRLYWAMLEENPALFSTHVTNQDLTAITARFRKYKPYFEVPDQIGRKFGFHTSPEHDQMAKELEATVNEHNARTKVLELWGMKNTYAGDTGNYMHGLFITPQRPKVDAMYFKTIGELGPTIEGKERFGILVDKAMRGWVDIAEGKVPGLSNPWTGGTYQSEMNQYYDYLTRNVTQGDRSAVRLAEILIRLFDIHVDYAVSGGGIDPKGRMAQILRAIGKVEGDKFILDSQVELAKRRDEYYKKSAGGNYVTDRDGNKIVADVDVEISDTTNDTAKVEFIGFRQLSEYASKDHPRAVAAPATIGCFPNLTGNALKMFNVTSEDGKYISLWKLWREENVPFGQLPWDEKEWEYRGKKYKGIAKGAEHVPYGLQKFYANIVSDAIMRKDFTEAGGAGQKGILNAEYLHSLNKAYELVFAILLGSTILGTTKEGRETITKLRQLTKVNMLIGIALARTPGPNGDINKIKNITDEMNQVFVPDLGIYGKRDVFAGMIIRAATKANFLSVRDTYTNGVRGTLYEKEVNLLNEIIKDGKYNHGLKPSRLVGSWFTQSEVNLLNQVGAYYPFMA